MESQHILAQVESGIVLDLSAQGLQQAIPSCLLALRAQIYLDVVRLDHVKRRVRSMSCHETPDRIVKLGARHGRFNVVKVDVRARRVIEVGFGPGDARRSCRATAHHGSRTVNAISFAPPCCCMARRVCEGCEWRL